MTLILLFLYLFTATACQPSLTTTEPPVTTAVSTPTLTAEATHNPIVAAIPPTMPPPATATIAPTSTSAPPPTPTPTAVPICESPDPAVWGKWCFQNDLFIYPLALDKQGDTFYLLDGGRVLALSASQPPVTLLAPGDVISDTRVIEPLDLVAGDGELLVLDRAGDVYRYETQTNTAVWTLDRYDRPRGKTASHYYIALDLRGQDRYLLDASYHYGLRYQVGDEAAGDSGWLLPDKHLVDMALAPTAEEDASQAYVLLQTPFTDEARLLFYEAGQEITRFQPAVDRPLTAPRQVRVTNTAVYVLDEAGHRLSRFDPRTGRLQEDIPLPTAVSTFWVTPDDSQLVLAGRDALYFWPPPTPQPTQFITGGTPLTGAQPHDPAVWEHLTPRLWPVQGAQLPRREIQMPGAPRHYRLGVHEGLDFYWSAGKEIRATAKGIVIRAMHDYTQPYPADYFAQRQASATAGYTPPAALDFYRGQQLWIEYEDGTIGRYAHLQAIDPTLQIGTAVAQGQIVGWVGNSGTPASETSPTEDTHLHYEIWLNETHHLGQFIRPSEARAWFATLFTAQPQ